MLKTVSEKREAWSTIIIFLAIVTAISSVLHYAIVALYPSRMYVGVLMWCPAIAAYITLRIKGRSITSLHWNWGDWKYIRASYATPFLYVLITYLCIWAFGLGGFIDEASITDWTNELGLEGLNTTFVILIASALLGTIGVIRAMATTLGEEIGWRGFFIYELRKVFSFTGVALCSGIIWGLWHWPIIVYYGNGHVVLEMTTFLVVIISMSIIMTYYTFKAKSVWPAVLFHAVSNIYIQKVFPSLTTEIDDTAIWLGENGIMFAIITLLFGLYFLRKALKEGM